VIRKARPRRVLVPQRGATWSCMGSFLDFILSTEASDRAIS